MEWPSFDVPSVQHGEPRLELKIAHLQLSSEPVPRAGDGAQSPKPMLGAENVPEPKPYATQVTRSFACIDARIRAVLSRSNGTG